MDKELISEDACGLCACNDDLYYMESVESSAGWKYFRYDLHGVHEVSEDDFVKAKFGVVTPEFKKFLGYDFAKADDCLYMCSYRSPCLVRLDRSGTVLSEWMHFAGHFYPIYSIDYQPPHFIWAAAPVNDAVVKVSLRTRQIEYQLCGDRDVPDSLSLCSPEAVRILDDYLYISDMGHERICRLDLCRLTLETYLQLDEPVYEFERVRGTDFVRLSSGLWRVFPER